MNFDIFSNINWLAVLVAALAYFILGAIWYSKALFGTRWAQLVGINTSDPHRGGLGKMLSATFILIVVTCVALALLVTRIDLFVVQSGITLGAITGICVASTAVAVSFVYESRPLGIYFIDCGYHVIGHVVAAVILVVWR